MLAFQDLQINERFMALCFRIGIFPYDLDRKSSYFKTTSRKLPAFIWQIRMLLGALPIMCKALEFLWCIVEPKDFCTNFNLVAHLMYILFCFMAMYIAYVIKYFSKQLMFLMTTMWRTKKEDYPPSRKYNSWNIFYFLKHRSFVDVAYKYLAVYYVPVIFLIFLGFVVLNHRGSYLLYTWIPPGWENDWLYAFSLLFEFWMIADVILMAYVGVVLLLLFAIPHICEDTLNPLEVAITNAFKWGYTSTQNVKGWLDKMRQTWLKIKIYNETISTINYIVKIVLMIDSICCFFIGIKYIDRDPKFCSALVVLAWYCFIFFIILYGRCYQVPEAVENVKAKIYLEDGKGLKMIVWKRYTRQVLRSFPPCSIEMGSFYRLDRMTTPVCIDFVWTSRGPAPYL